jgi:integrase
MFDELGHRGRQEWFFLDAIASGRITPQQLYGAWSSNDLAGLRTSLDDVDLRFWLDAWLASLVGQITEDSQKRYRVHLETLLKPAEPFPRSRLTVAVIKAWLAGVGNAAGTRRRYRAARSTFCEYLWQNGVLPDNPVRKVKAPPLAPPRCSHIDLKATKRLLASLGEPYRTIAAIAHGCGADLSQILALRRCDIERSTQQLHLRGGKNERRDRIVLVEDWAWKYVLRHLERIKADAPLFPLLNRWTTSDKFRAACKRVGITDYWLRDSRHSYAVRLARSGASLEIIARQLGHADVALVAKVYARYRPDQSEIRNAHARAARLPSGGAGR